MTDASPVPVDMKLDDMLVVECDGTPAGTIVCVGDRQIPMVQNLRLQITPDGVMVHLTVLNPKLKLKGTVVSLVKVDPDVVD